MSKENSAGVIAPPPLIFLGFLLIGLLADAFLAMPRLGASPLARMLAAACLAIPAVFIMASAITRFARKGTPVQPWRPSTAIVADGIYRFTRNPMYLSMAMLYAAIAIGADSLIALVMLLPALLLMQFGVIRREERYLESKFGEEYRRYKAAVRRWI